jgi:hypothetical protein
LEADIEAMLVRRLHRKYPDARQPAAERDQVVDEL